MLGMETQTPFANWDSPMLGGTTKTGLSFGLQAVATCPVKSPNCAKCYARNRHSYGFPAVIHGQQRRFAISQTDSFVPRMTGELIAQSYKAFGDKLDVLRFRLHDSGDFYDCRYIESWIAIVEAVNAAAPVPVLTWVPTRVWAASAIPAKVEGKRRLNPRSRLVKLAAFDTCAVRPSALKPDVRAPRIVGLAAGHGVITREELAKGMVCPVSRATNHNHHRSRVAIEGMRPTSCADYGCDTCWRKETETDFIRH